MQFCSLQGQTLSNKEACVEKMMTEVAAHDKKWKQSIKVKSIKLAGGVE